MRFIDRVLQNWRARMAKPWIPAGARVLDIGCHEGEFLQSLGRHIGPSLGYDPLAPVVSSSRHRLVPEIFTAPSEYPDGSFNAVVMLATLEHVHEKEPLAREFFRILKPGGRVIITVPSQFVDHIVHTLCRLKLADGMSLDEHHGFDPTTTPDIFGRGGFRLERWRSFQLGLNHLFVFRKPIDVPATQSPPLRLLAYAG
jgi:SAM-dependent methyltransferase